MSYHGKFPDLVRGATGWEGWMVDGDGQKRPITQDDLDRMLDLVDSIEREKTPSGRLINRVLEVRQQKEKEQRR